MSASDQARLELVSTLNLLMRRRAATSDTAEKSQINESIDIINEQLQELGHASLLEAATIAAAAGAELEKVVATARTGAFDAFVGQAESQIARLRKVGAAVVSRPVGSSRPAKPATRAGATAKRSPAKKAARSIAAKPVGKATRKPAKSVKRKPVKKTAAKRTRKKAAPRRTRR